MADNSELTLAVKAQTKELTDLTAKLGKLVDGFEKTDKEAKEAGSSFDKFLEKGARLTIVADGLLKLANGLGKVASTGIEAFESLGRAQVELENISNTVGVARETLAGLQERVEELGGTPEQAARSLTTFGGAIQDSINDPTSEAAKKVEALGVRLSEIKNASNPVEAALRQVGEATKGVNLSLEQSQAASDVFGRGFKQVVGALGDLDETIASIKAKGQFLNDEDAEAAKELFAAFDELRDTLDGLTNQFLADLLPAVENVTDTIAKLRGELGQDEEFKKGFEGLKGVAEEFVGKTLPLIVEGIGRAIQITGQYGNEIKLLADGFTTLITLGGNVFKAQEEAAEASIRVQLQIQKNEEFLRIFNSTLSESEKLIQANAIVLENEGKELEERRKRLQENAEEQEKLTAKQIEAIGANNELLASIKALKNEQKEGLDLDKLAADQRKLNIRRTVKDADEAAEEIGKIDAALAQKQIDNAQAVLDKIEATVAEREAAANRLVANIRATETDQQKAIEKTLAVLKGFNDFRKSLEPEITAQNQKIVDGEEKKTKVTEDGEKRKQKAITDTRKLKDADLAIELATLDQEIEAKRRLGAADQELAKLEVKRLELAIENTNKRIAELAKESDKLGEIKKLQLELIGLEGDLAAAKARTAVAAKQATSVILDGFEAERQAIEGLADRAKSAAGAISDLNGRIVSVQETFREDFTDPESIERTRQQIADLMADAEQIAFRLQGIIVDRLEFARSFSEAAERLQRELDEAIAKQRREAEQASAEERLRIAKDTVERLKEIEKDLQEDLQNLRQEIRKAERKAAEDRQNEIDDFNAREEDAEADHLADIKKLRADAAARDAADRKREQDQIIQDTINFQDRLRDIVNEALQKALDDRFSFLEKKGEIEGQITAAEAEAAAAREAGDGDAVTKAEEKIKTLKGQLQALVDQENARNAREKRRQEEIGKAEAEAQEKLKNAKTTTEAEAIQAELEARINGINEKFDAEEDFERRLAALKGKASEETLNALRAAFQEQLKLIDDRTNSEITKIRDTEKEKTRIRNEEIAAAKAALEQQIKDRQDAFNEEKAQRDEQHQARLKQIDDQLREEKKRFRDARKEIKDDAIQSLKDIAAASGLTEEELAKLFDEAKVGGIDFNAILEKIVGNLGKVGQAAGALSNTSAQPSGTQQQSSGSLLGGSGSTGSGLSPFGGSGNASNRVVSAPTTTSASQSSAGPSFAPPSITAQPGGDIEDIAGYNEGNLRERLRNLFERMRAGKINYKRVLEVIGLLRDKRKVNNFDAPRLAALFKIAKNKQQFNEGLEQIFNPGRTASDFGGSQADFGSEPSLGSGGLAPTGAGPTAILPPKPGKDAPFIVPFAPNLPVPNFPAKPTNGAGGSVTNINNNITNNFTGFFGPEAIREIEKIIKEILRDLFNRRKIF